MPTYDYRCTACEHPFETIHGMREQPRVVCPECGSLARRRIASAVGLLGAGDSHDHGGHAHDHAPSAGGCGQCPGASGEFPCAWNRSPSELGF